MRDIASEYGWVAVRLAAFNLLAFLVIPLLTKTMGADAYGYWSQFQAFIQFGVPVFTLNLQTALVRFFPGTDRGERNVVISSIVWPVLICGGLAGLLILIAREPIAAWFFDGRTDLVVLLAIVIGAAALNKLLYNYLRACRYIRLHSLLTIAERVFLLLLAGGLVWANQDILWIVASSPVSLIVFLGVLAVFVFREQKLVAPDWSKVRRYTGFTVPFLLGTIGLTIVEISDRYLLAFFANMDVVGTYTTAYGVGRGFKLMAMPFIFVLPAVISEYWDQGNEEKVSQLLYRSFRYFLLSFGLVAAVVGPAAEGILAFISTRNIASQGYLVLLLIALSYFFYTVWFFYSRWLYLTQQSGILGTMWAVGGAVNIGLNIVLIPRLGVVGAALATLASQALVGGWAFLVYGRRIRVSPDSRTVWGGLLAAGGTGLMTWWVRSTIEELELYFVFAATVAPLVYGTAIILTGAIRRDEVHQGLDVLRDAVPDRLR